MKTKNKFLIYLIPSLFLLHILVRGVMATQQDTHTDFISQLSAPSDSQPILIESKYAIALK